MVLYSALSFTIPLVQSEILTTCVFISSFLNDVANDAESTQNSINTPVVASLKSEPTCKLILTEYQVHVFLYQAYQARL